MTQQLIIILSIVIAYAGLYIYKPRIALFLFIGILPLMHKELFSIYQWDYLPARFAALGLGLGLAVKLIFLLKKLGKTKFLEYLNITYVNDRFLLLLVIFLLIKVFAAYASGTDIFTNQFILFFVEVNMIYVAFKLAFSENPSLPKEVLYMYICMGFVAVLFAYVQLYLFYTLGMKIGSIWPVPDNLPRLGSLFWDVNHFGGFLVTLIPLLFAMIFGIRKLSYKALSFIALGICSVTLFLTQSRSSWLGLAIGMIVGVVLLLTRRNFKPVLLFILGAIVMAGVFFAYLDIKDLSIRQKIASYMHYRLDSTDTHVMLLEGAVQIYVKDPLLGAGPGNFDSSFRNTETSSKYFEREPKLKSQKVPPHSVWGEVISENGYLGFSAFLFISVFALLSALFAFYRSDSSEKSYLGLGLFISMISILVTGIFYSYNLEFFWVFIFLVVMYSASVLNTNINFSSVFRWASQQKIVYLGAIISISAFFIFINLGGVTLLEWDEAIYAKVARNIYESGDWLNLYWTKIGSNWFEKPPLYMWLSALTYSVTGPDEFGARLWSAILGLSTIVITFFVGKTLFNKFSGYIAALVLLATAHFLYYSRTSQLDVPVTFFIMSSILAYVYAIKDVRSVKSRLLLMVLSGALIGGGVMTKAIIGLIPGVIILLNELTTLILERKRPNYMGILVLGLATLFVAGPWHVYSYMTHGEDFIDTYLFKHIFDRSTEGLGHANSLFWYIDVLKVSLRIWIFPLAAAIPIAIYKFKKDKNLRLILIAFVFTFVFFSLPKDKLLWYIIPIYPFAALLVGKFTNDALVFVVKRLSNNNSLILNYKLVFIVIFTLFVPFYITTIKDKIFYEDGNQSIVELIKVHNQIYPVSQFPDQKLRFATAPYTVILFYSEHEPKPIEKEELMDIVKKSSPDKFYTFLITENRFYEMRGRLRVEFEEPYDLRIKAAAGRYVIARSYSNTELLQERAEQLVPEINDLKVKLAKGTISNFDMQKYNSLKTEYLELVRNLNEKGYPIQNQIIFE